MPAAATPQQTEACDIAVLGGGMLGIWIARRAAARGMRVSIIEKGPLSLSEQRDAIPALKFPARQNLGALRARNHVLSGNSAYWGGGLVRNSRAALLNVLGGDEAGPLADAILARSGAVESHFGITPPVMNGPVDGVALDSLEVAILPGRRRGVWSQFGAELAKHPNITCHTSATIREVTVRDGGVRAITIDTPAGSRSIEPRHVVISMGVVDSNLFVAEHLREHLPPDARDDVGRHLHDHWSAPVARLHWRNGTPLSSFFPMSNQRGGMLDRRLAFSDGYFHFTADFGAIPPYDRVKKLMNTRQKGAGLGPVARDALACFTRPILLSHAALHYLSKKQIYVPDGSEITLAVDFAAFPSPANRIFGATEDATLDWDIRAEDAARFHSLCRHHRQGLCDMITRAGVGVEWLVPDDPSAAEAHLRRTAVDAYHLGGGLQPVVHDRPGPTSVGGELRGLDNVRVLGTAAFCSAGIANPVLTLFTWGDTWVDSLVAEHPADR